MTDAIITKLKTGSITTVYARGDRIVSPDPPYVVVSPAGNAGAGNLNLEQYFVTPHFPRGFWDDLDAYLGEARGLLSGQALTNAAGITAVVESSGAVGPLIDSNDNGSISRELTFIAPGMVL